MRQCPYILTNSTAVAEPVAGLAVGGVEGVGNTVVGRDWAGALAVLAILAKGDGTVFALVGGVAGKGPVGPGGNGAIHRVAGFWEGHGAVASSSVKNAGADEQDQHGRDLHFFCATEIEEARKRRR